MPVEAMTTFYGDNLNSSLPPSVSLLGGSDNVLGGDGNDVLIGQAGHDELRGEDGNDTIKWWCRQRFRSMAGQRRKQAVRRSWVSKS